MRSTTVLTTAVTVALTAGALAASVVGAAAPVTAAPVSVAPVSVERGAAERGAAAPPRLGPCDAGQLCLWAKEGFRGARQTHELADLDIDACVPLPAGSSAASLANRTGRPVTTYQSAECAETGEFETYPGGGTWVPQSPYKVRAFKVWET